MICSQALFNRIQAISMIESTLNSYRQGSTYLSSFMYILPFCPVFLSRNFSGWYVVQPTPWVSPNWNLNYVLVFPLAFVWTTQRCFTNRLWLCNVDRLFCEPSYGEFWRYSGTYVFFPSFFFCGIWQSRYTGAKADEEWYLPKAYWIDHRDWSITTCGGRLLPLLA